jgi:cytoskeletal protein RodZ
MQDPAMAALLLCLGVIVGALGAWLWQRKLAREQQARLAQADHARQQSQMFADQARKQIEQLKLELADLRKAAGPALAGRPRPVLAPVAAPVDEPDEPAPDGFAQTQMMRP